MSARFWCLRTWAMLYRFDEMVYVDNGMYDEHLFLLWWGRNLSGWGQSFKCCVPTWLTPIKPLAHKARVSFCGWQHLTCFYTPLLGKVSVSLWLHQARTPRSLCLVSPRLHPEADPNLHHFPVLNCSYEYSTFETRESSWVLQPEGLRDFCKTP